MTEAFVLSRGFRDRDDGLQLEYWATSARGPLLLRYPQAQANLFVERETQTLSGIRRNIALTTLQHRPVDAVYFGRQRELVAERSRLQALGTPTFEADIRPSDRFLMERFVTGGCVVDGPIMPRAGYLELIAPAISPSEYRPSLRVLSIDIETDVTDGTLLSVGLAGDDFSSVLMCGPEVESPHTRFFADERALIRGLVETVRDHDPDIIVGWNVVEFDLRFLIERARRLRVPLSLGRDGSGAQTVATRSKLHPHIARVAGRLVLDGIATLRGASHHFESYALEDVARQLLGRGKLIEEDVDKAAEVRRLFAEDKAALAAYNLEDCKLVLEIFERTDLLEFLLERQQLTGLPMDRAGGSVAAFDYLYLPRLHRQGCVAASVERDGEGQPSPGGHVMDSAPGLYNNVIVLDFKSLYPSIIRTFRIDPLAMAFPGDDAIEGFDGAWFARDRHILPGLIERLWAARDAAKRRGDAASSQATKILMNSFYGVLGTRACRFFDARLASSITRRGHEIILQSRTIIEAERHRVIYGDTDSLFVHLGDDLTAERCAQIGRQLADTLNRYWRDELRERYRIDSALELQFETHYLRFFMPTIRGSERGSKKRYAGVVREAGRLVTVFKGLEAVRSDWTPLARGFQRELYRRVFLGEPFEDYIREVCDQVRSGGADRALVYRKQLRRPLDNYVSNVPPHVQAARKLPRAGRHVEYCMTIRGPQPASALSAPLDYEHYVERQLRPIADAILGFCGTSFERVAGRQLPLF